MPPEICGALALTHVHPHIRQFCYWSRENWKNCYTLTSRLFCAESAGSHTTLQASAIVTA
jgi:hypothetical protein